MSIYQHLQTNLQQYDVGRFFIKLSVGGMLGLLFSAAMLGVAAPAVQAKQDTTAIKATISQVFGPDGPAAIRVATCESGLDPSAYNPISVRGSHAKGLFQILVPSTWRTTAQAGQSPYNADANTLAAHEIFVRDGHSWREWVCKP